MPTNVSNQHWPILRAFSLGHVSGVLPMEVMIDGVLSGHVAQGAEVKVKAVDAFPSHSLDLVFSTRVTDYIRMHYTC